MELQFDHLDDTFRVGRRLGELLFPNSVVALIGGLGAGKTHFSRAIAEGLHVRNPLAVTSPTFVLIQEYPARLPIFHFDVYRLGSVREFLELGALEYFTQNGVCLIEWADRVLDALPKNRLDIHLTATSETSRRATFTPHGDDYSHLLNQLQATLTADH